MGRKLPAGSRLVVASHNKGKLAEFADLLRPLRIAIVSAAELGLPEPDEPAPDFAGNARIKALAAGHSVCGLPAILRKRFRFLRPPPWAVSERIFGPVPGWSGQGISPRPWHG